MSLAVNQVYNMDGIELMKLLPDASVDAFVTDLPYGTTACSWDEIIPFEPMWAEVRRTLKPRGVFVTTASQPFTSKLVMSNVNWFRCEWVWHKHSHNNFPRCNQEPLKVHENILLFASGDGVYNPQMRKGEPYVIQTNGGSKGVKGNSTGRLPLPALSVNHGTRFPISIIDFTLDKKQHPTQKPVALYEYLISTYTQTGDLVVDFCCGSGTTAIAARNLGRRFIAGDQSEEYCEITRKRLAQPYTPLMSIFLEEQNNG